MRRNQNYQLRELIIFQKEIDWKNRQEESIHFDELSWGQLRDLLANDFLHPMDAHHTSPTVEEILIFMEKYPQSSAHGYIMSPFSNDSSIIIEGVSCQDHITSEMKKDFEQTFKNADEFIANPQELYCWYD